MGRKAGVRRRRSRTTLPRDWSSRRARVLAEEGHTCEHDGPRCTTVATEVHHRTARAMGGGHERANLMAVCHTCHVELTDQPSVPFPWGR